MWYEIRKVYAKKGMFLFIAALCAAVIFYPAYETYNYKKVNKHIEKAYEQVWETMKGKGGFAPSAFVNRGMEEWRKNGSKYYESPWSEYGWYLCKEQARKTGSSQSYYFDFNMEEHSLQGIETQLKEAEEGSAFYRRLIREKEMMERCSLEYSPTHFWERYDVYELLLTILIFLAVLFPLSGIYQIEKAENRDTLLCAASVGRFRILRNKWLAGLLPGIVGIVFMNLCLASVYLIGGSMSGYEKGLVNLGGEFVYTPYNITIGTYMLIKIGIHILAMIFLVVFVEYVSLVSSHRALAVLFGGLLFFPQLAAYFIIGRNYFKIVDLFYDWSLLGGIYPGHLFYKYHAVSVFGIPVDYPILYVAMLLALTFVFGVLTKKRFYGEGLFCS